MNLPRVLIQNRMRLAKLTGWNQVMGPTVAATVLVKAATAARIIVWEYMVFELGSWI